MAGRAMGRAACPECGFPAAHVRQNEGKHPYRYCPECGANYATRNARQAADLLAKTRPEGAASSSPAPEPAAPPAPATVAPAPAAPAPAPAPPKRQSWAGLLLDATTER